MRDGTQAEKCMWSLAVLAWRLRWPLAILWPLLAIAMVPFTVKLFARLAPFPSGAPEDTRSAVAEAVISRHFQHIIGMRREMVVLRCKRPCESAATLMSIGYVQEIKDLVERFGDDHPGTVIQVHSYYTYSKLKDNPMISHDGQSILLQWTWRVPDRLKAVADAFLGDVIQQIDTMNSLQSDGPEALDISATGPSFLERVLRITLIKEIPVHELSTMWVPFIIVALSLRSVRLLFITMVSMPLRILPAFGIMYFVSLETTVLCDALNLMLMLCTGLTFDYSLFTLARYAEERAAGATAQEAVLVSTSQSGHVVVVTGGVLMISYGSMLVLPGAFKSFCIAACAMTFICMAVQLTWVPAILAICPCHGVPSPQDAPRDSDEDWDPEHSDKECSSDPVVCQQERPESIYKAVPANLPDEKLLGTASPEGAIVNMDAGPDTPMGRAGAHMKGNWFWIGGQLTAFPRNIIVPLLVYIVMMPLSLRMTNFRMGHGFELQVPRHVHEWSLGLEIQKDFSPDVGTFYPMLIIGTKASAAGATNASVAATSATTPFDVRNQDFFDANCEMIERLITETKGTRYALGPENFISAAFHEESGQGNGCLNYQLTQIYRNNFLTQRFFVTSKFLQELWDQLTNHQHDAMLTLLNPRVDPFSSEAFDLVNHLRTFLHTFKPQGADLPGLTFKTLSATSAMMDMIEVTDTRGKIALLVCAMICFAAIAISFGAALIPIKMLFTVIVPLTWTYGAAVYVFEDGVLAWSGIESLSPTGQSGIHWTVFMLTPTLMLGLALDYDIFLFTRVFEFRKEGFGELESIQLGLAATGPIITSAGLIMAFSFGGQLMASIAVPNQMGFCLVFSILVDTFIVRTVLVPAMLSLSPRMNYWPSQMPPVQYEWLSSAQKGDANRVARLK